MYIHIAGGVVWRESEPRRHRAEGAVQLKKKIADQTYIYIYIYIIYIYLLAGRRATQSPCRRRRPAEKKRLQVKRIDLYIYI